MWSWAPQTLATSMSLKCRDAIVTTKEESKPLNKSIPNGTSVKFSPWITQIGLCSWGLWQTLYKMDGERHKQIPKNLQDEKNMGGNQLPSWR